MAIEPERSEEFNLVDNVHFVKFAPDDLSGEELKELMVDGRLPDEYINEKTLSVLLSYEYEQMWESPYYDVSVIIYCTDLLIRKYADAERLDWWGESFENIKGTVQSIDGNIKESQLAYFSELLAAKHPDKVNDKQFMQCQKEKFMRHFDMSEPQASDEPAEAEKEVSKKNHRSKAVSHIWKRVTAVSIILIVLFSGFTITAVNTNLFGMTGAFTRRMWRTLVGVGEIAQDDDRRMGIGARRYETVEAFEESSGIQILVPTWLPSGLEITHIHYHHEEGHIDVYYDYEIIWLRIRLNSAMPNADGAEIYEHDDITFYVFEDANIIWWEYDEDFYHLTLGFDVYGYTEKIIINIK